MSTDLLAKVKANLFLTSNDDDELITNFINAVINYAESYQHIPTGSYSKCDMPPSTEQAIIILSSYFYALRDSSSGTIYKDSMQSGLGVWNTVNMLLESDRV